MEPVTHGTSAPRRVAFVFVSMPVGGAEDFALAAADNLGPEFEAHFVCLRDLGVLGEELRAAGKNVHLGRFFPSKLVNPLNIHRFASWLRRNNIAIVHSQTHHAHIFATRAARIAGLPCVVHQQKTLEPLPWRRRRIFGACLRRADRVVALSGQTAGDLTLTFRLPTEKISVVPNAIDKAVFRPAADKATLRRDLGLPPDGLLLGTMARLHGDKNHAAIVEAMALLPRGEVPATAVFVGEGPLRGELENLAKVRGVGARVIFAGRQRPVVPWFQALDVFVLSSKWEGQPLAMLQALACGLPVLASRIEGNTAVLGGAHPGLFPADDPAALARLIEQAGKEDFRTLLLDAQRGIAVPGGDDAGALLKAIYSALAP